MSKYIPLTFFLVLFAGTLKPMETKGHAIC